MNIKICFSAAMLCLGFLTANASTLDGTAIEILNNSLEYKWDLYSLQTFSQTVKTENNLPDPQLSGEFLAAPTDEKDRWSAELSWGLDWPGLYHAKGKEADKKILAARMGIEVKKIERLAEIKKLLLSYVLCRKKLNLLRILAENNDSISKLAARGLEGGEITILDLNKVKIEYANIKASQAGVLNEEADVLAELSTIYGADCRGLLEEMECEFPEIQVPSDQHLESVSISAPSVVAAGVETEVARQSRKVASMEALPSIEFGYKHAYEDGFHFNGAILGISIPVFSSRGKQKAAKAAIAEAELKQQNAGIEVGSELKELQKKLILLKSQIDEIEPILTETDYNAYLLKAYQAGTITVLDYLTERNYFTAAELELLTLRHAAAVAQVDLSKYM